MTAHQSTVTLPNQGATAIPDIVRWFHGRTDTTLLLTATPARPNRLVRSHSRSRYGHVIAVDGGQVDRAAAFGPRGFTLDPLEGYLRASLYCATVELEYHMDAGEFANCRRYDYLTCLLGGIAYRCRRVPQWSPRRERWTCVTALGPALGIELHRFAVPDIFLSLGKSRHFVRVDADSFLPAR